MAVSCRPWRILILAMTLPPRASTSGTARARSCSAAATEPVRSRTHLTPDRSVLARKCVTGGRPAHQLPPGAAPGKFLGDAAKEDVTGLVCSGGKAQPTNSQPSSGQPPSGQSGQPSSGQPSSGTDEDPNGVGICDPELSQYGAKAETAFTSFPLRLDLRPSVPQPHGLVEDQHLFFAVRVHAEIPQPLKLVLGARRGVLERRLHQARVKYG